MRLPALAVAALLALGAAPLGAQDRLPVFDAHLHYSHDAWGLLDAQEAAAVLRRAGLRRAMVSSSDDEGTQRLVAAAPDLVLPVLRPYRKRGDQSTWMRDETVIDYLEQRLARYRYVAIGEFHLYGADADLPVPRRMVELAKRHGLALHAHSDREAVERLIAQFPEGRILWAHSGFARPDEVGDMLRRHPRLWADLAFRSDHASGGRLDAEWRSLFLEFPDRFMLGTDTFTPERWHYVVEHAEWSRGWLQDLPPDVAERIAWRNGEAVFGTTWRGQ